LGSALCFGIGFWLQGTFAAPDLGGIVPTWLYYIVGTVLMAALARPARQALQPPPLQVMPAVLGTGFLSFLGYAALSIGLGTGEVAVVTVLSSLASAVTVLLGRVLFHERLALHQWVGIIAIIAGLVLMNGGR
ncbi:MAG: DMT family transporter, partial [Alphaproteobacteria bacterium]|nr:DMT family transporter [Alphaproteobacteria bacterium]